MQNHREEVEVLHLAGLVPHGVVGNYGGVVLPGEVDRRFGLYASCRFKRVPSWGVCDAKPQRGG